MRKSLWSSIARGDIYHISEGGRFGAVTTRVNTRLGPPPWSELAEVKLTLSLPVSYSHLFLLTMPNHALVRNKDIFRPLYFDEPLSLIPHSTSRVQIAPPMFCRRAAFSLKAPTHHRDRYRASLVSSFSK